MKLYRTIFITLSALLTLYCADSYSQGIMVPGGTGAWGNMLYIGAGGAMGNNEVSNLSDAKSIQDLKSYGDASIAFGSGFGNPMRTIGFQSEMNVMDVDQFDLFNFGAKIHRYIGGGVFAAIGTENMILVDLYGNRAKNIPAAGSDVPLSKAGSNNYVAFTHDLSYLDIPETSVLSRLSYSLGVGIGRFGNGDAKGGTYVFGATQVKLSDYSNLHVEWTGQNMNAGFTMNWKIGKLPFSAMIAIADLTPYSGNGPKLMLGGGGAIPLWKPREVDGQKNFNSIMKSNETLAMTENDKKQRDYILSEKTSVEEKIALLEKELAELKAENNDLRTNVSTLEKDLADSRTSGGSGTGYNGTDYNGTDYNGTDYNRGNTNNGEDVVYSSNEMHGYDTYPGNYVVVASFQKKDYAETAAANYKKAGFDAGLVYNRDKEMHYVFVNKYPPTQAKEAWANSAEQRKKGFSGAWVYEIRGAGDPSEAFYYRPNPDSLKNFAGDYIVKITTGDDNKTPIENGCYIILDQKQKYSDALSAANDLDARGIPANIIYNQSREQHYLYSDVLGESESEAALSSRESIKGDFPNSFVMNYNKVAQKYTGDQAVSDFATDDVFEIDLLDDSQKTAPSGNYYVVISSFVELKNAKKSLAQFKSRGFSCEIAFNEDRNRYYVYTFKGTDKNEALTKRDGVRSRIKEAWIFKF